MSGLVRKSLLEPEETRPFGKGRLDLVNMPTGQIGRSVFEPGWRWSSHVKPIANTDSCQTNHFGYVISGRMMIVMEDGESAEFGPGDVMVCPAGHDAWVLGDEPCMIVDWQGASTFAKG